MKRKASNNHIKEEVISCAPSITLLSGGSRKKHCFLSSTFPGTGRGRGRSPVGPTQCLGMAARLGTAPIQHYGRRTVPTGKLTKLGGSHPKNGAKKKSPCGCLAEFTNSGFLSSESKSWGMKQAPLACFTRFGSLAQYWLLSKNYFF